MVGSLLAVAAVLNGNTSRRLRSFVEITPGITLNLGCIQFCMLKKLAVGGQCFEAVKQDRWFLGVLRASDCSATPVGDEWFCNVVW